MKQRWRLPVIQQLAHYSSPNDSSKNPEDQPIKYTTSEAAAWKAVHARGGEDDKPWYQSIVISASVGIFLLYFCYLREENDIDEELGKPLYDRVAGLEEQLLTSALKNYKERGMDTREIENRLNQLKEKKNFHEE